MPTIRRNKVAQHFNIPAMREMQESDDDGSLYNIVKYFKSAANFIMMADLIGKSADPFNNNNNNNNVNINCITISQKQR